MCRLHSGAQKKITHRRYGIIETINTVTNIIISVITVMMTYKIIYGLIGFFGKEKKFPTAKRLRSFGIVVCARDESAVIGNLLDSIEKQSYPKELIKVYVVADNCKDDTADICRAHGATVYERFNKTKKRKGYAMGFLFESIKRDFGIDSLDAYVVFDADNVLSPNYLAEINKALDTDGCDIALGYRNTKNFDENIISAAYGIHFLRASALTHRARAKLGFSTHIAGTGYAIRSELLLNGWNHFSLTEDTEFTITSFANGKKAVFCEAAEFYDEQPHSVGIMIRQRLRWEKGRLMCFFRYIGRLLTGAFKNRLNPLSSYDMFMYFFPKSLFVAFLSLIYPVAQILAGIFDPATLLGLPLLLLRSAGTMYLGCLFHGAVTVIRERRHIKCSTGKLILYTLAFPWFDLTGLPIAIVSLFIKVKWKRIRHDRDIKIDELVENTEKETVNA